MNANVIVRPNVICTKLLGQDGKGTLEEASPEEIARRVGYWELLALTEARPMLYSSRLLQRENLTSRQLAELDGFVRPHARRLWPDGWAFTPMPAKPVPLPFFEKSSANMSAKARPQLVVRRQLKTEPSTGHERAGVGVTCDRQAEVIKAPLDKSMIVLAPPGTGKTYALVERLCHLIRHAQIKSPSEEVLVLSFTRSAVGELSRRVVERTNMGSEDDLRFIAIRTFDSFATRMLLKDNRPEELAGSDYEGRIEEFTKRLKGSTAPQAETELQKLKWLLVDEVQDIVASRAEMVLELIARVRRNQGTVMLLGDPAQAIYDWETGDEGMRSHEFLSRARSLLGEDVQEIELVNYRRYSADLLPLILKARESVGKDGRETAGPALRSLLTSIGRPKPLQDVKTVIKGGGTVAALTRTNIEAFQLSEWCGANGLPAIRRRGSDGNHWPGWMARLTFGFKQDKMSLAMARQRWDALVAERSRESWAAAVDFLKEQRLVAQNTIDLYQLSLRVLERGPVQAESKSGLGTLIISTIHRSKGMEFDSVFMLEPNILGLGDPGEVRTLYVAATRARSRLQLMSRDTGVFDRSWRKEGTHHFRRFRTGVNRLLIEGLTDVDAGSIIMDGEGSARDTGKVRLAQEALWSRCSSGASEIESVLDGNAHVLAMPDTADGGATLKICRLGNTVEEDIRSLERFYRKKVQRVTRLRVVGLASVAFPPDDDSAREALGEARLALLPVIEGEAFLET